MNQESPGYRSLTRSISKSLESMRADLPEVMQAFTDLGRAASKAGALDPKTKELIALALGVAARCDGCIGFHVKTLVKLGASKAELQEMLAMAVYMGGGPSLMYSANALAAFDEFSQA
ncbi:carboxymuconolactone decarboxylase family protein [Lacisediminimonas sp.]|uniref:carboxymuconolactone decarboxylase family protein n=1 Tax=Lacisediminimonas sp. TaxID=3060582 RepID=UPI0027208DE2|nr:carboxymuconolactone decarboxylase family protein [Lacisediminimonas sp.]MDO8299225.1 carboxymuconolactone decarboxylase family protein [Lacisediminimonas sp.]